MHAPTSLPRFPRTALRLALLGLALPVLAESEAPVQPPLPSAAGYAARAAGAATAAPPAGEAAWQWIEGNSVYNYNNNCATGTVEMLTGQYTGYYGKTDASAPVVNQVYYGHIVIAGMGFPCAGPYVHVEAFPPPSSNLVFDDQYPIRCFYTNTQGVTSEVPVSQGCPRHQDLWIGPFGGWSLDSTIQGPWPLAQGAFWEFWFPMTSSQPLSGIATNSWMYGLVQALAGTSYHAVAKQGVFVAPAPGPSCPAQAKGDFNRDGRPDLLWRHQASNRNMLWTMNGPQAAAASWISPDPSGPQWQVVGADDFDLDGRSDLLFANSQTGALEFWVMNGATRNGPAYVMTGATPPAPPWRVAATGDFNRDGKPDLVYRNGVTQKIEVWTLDGSNVTGKLYPTPDQAADANWEIVAALDYNADGKRDLLWYNGSSGKIVVWFLNESLQRVTGQFAAPPNAGDANWKVLAGGDYSAFNTPPGEPWCTNDIVWRNATSGRAVVWHMDNAATRLAGQFTAPDGPTADPSGAATARTDWTLAGPR